MSHPLPKIFFLLSLLCLNGGSMNLPASADEPLPGYRIEVDYRITESGPLQGSLFFPKGIPRRGNWPVVLFVHGGGWIGNDRSAALDWRHREVHRLILDSRVAVFAIDYRKHPVARNVGDPLSDVLAALRWIAEKGPANRLDAGRIAIWGSSAGGHLALMAVIEANRSPGSGTPVPRRIAAWYPATRLDWILEDSPGDASKRSRGLGFNPKRDEQMNRAYSPLEHADWLQMPTLFIHGENDPLFFPRHSEALHWELQKRSRASSLIIVKNGVHGFVSSPGDEGIRPDLQIIWQQTADFLSLVADD